MELIHGTKGMVGSTYAGEYHYRDIIGAKVEFLGNRKYDDLTMYIVRVIDEESPRGVKLFEWYIHSDDFLPLSPTSNEQAACYLSRDDE